MTASPSRIRRKMPSSSVFTSTIHADAAFTASRTIITRALQLNWRVESANHHQGKTRRKNPRGNQKDPEQRCKNDRAAPAPFLREMTDNRSAADGAKGVNDPGRRLLRHAVVPLFAKKSLIHVLGAV